MYKCNHDTWVLGGWLFCQTGAEGQTATDGEGFFCTCRPHLSPACLLHRPKLRLIRDTKEVSDGSAKRGTASHQGLTCTYFVCVGTIWKI